MDRELTIRLFGAFRQVSADSTLSVSVPASGRVKDLRRAMDEKLTGNDNARSLLKASAFATDSEVLGDDDRIPDGEISVLPPVCGG